MISVPVWTVEKPITVIDYIAALSYCETVDEVRQFGEQCPLEVREDERFSRAVAGKLADVNGRRPMRVVRAA